MRTATDPDLILLDEPLSGLDMKASENLQMVFRRVVERSDRTVSLLLVEHDVAAVLSLSDWIFVLDFGERFATACPDDIRRDPAVRLAYLGDEDPRPRRALGAFWYRSGGWLNDEGAGQFLEVEELSVHYGTSQALFGVGLQLDFGSVLAVLGANGAGKSTLARGPLRTRGAVVRHGRFRRRGDHRSARTQRAQARTTPISLKAVASSRV